MILFSTTNSLINKKASPNEKKTRFLKGLIFITFVSEHMVPKSVKK